MPTVNDIKEQISVIRSVGEFTNAMQQIATLRMMRLRDKVLASRPFVEAAITMMRELNAQKEKMEAAEKMKLSKKQQAQVRDVTSGRRAVIVITSNQGLTGQYNIRIYNKIEQILEQEKGSEFFIIGKKGQEVFAGNKFKVQAFPYEVPDEFQISDLMRLVRLFDFYEHITLVYSRYFNSAKQEVVVTSIVAPELEPSPEEEKQPGKYMFEPDIYDLIDNVSKKLRAALFQQQILDARLAQFSAQMIGMKTASDNSVKMLGELQLEYNKARRKLIDKKISEVFAGSASWKS
jgi:F-type H+-transporting ATPase subunit gamma